MRDVERYFTLPGNADKILFAEDFVNHMLCWFKLPLLSSGIANHRAIVYNAFTLEMRNAANYVYRLLEDELSEEFENISNRNVIDNNAFLKYAIPLKFRTRMFPTELGGQNLIHFCVKISTMASKFCQHGFSDAPVLAVDSIADIIDDVDMMGGGWSALNIVAGRYSQLFIDMDNYLTPESASDYDWESESLSTLSSKNSEASRSPYHEMDGGDGQEEHPEEFSDSDYCNSRVSASSSPAEERVSSSSDRKHVAKRNDVKVVDVVRSSDNMGDSASPGSSKGNRVTNSFRSCEVTTSEDVDSKQKIREKQNLKSSHSHSRASDSGSDQLETDLKATDRIDRFGRQLARKRSAILRSPVKELHGSDSDNRTTEDTSLIEEEDGVQSSRAKSSPLQTPVPKRRK